tara:strand:- start:262 stop:735 length:474 start_codon:yes stop_codon:yes gene_type:complete
MDLSKEQIDYFWARVDQSGGNDACWNWTGYCFEGGYGQVKFKRKHYSSHVLALTLSAGPKPADKPMACHNCKQNKICCNPAHLRWDTQAQNIQDKITDGTMARGETHGRVKLTELQVKEIREKYKPFIYTSYQLADEYDVSQTQIRRILNKEVWAHI